MTAGRFGTLAAVRELEAAGVDPRHAKAIVSVQRRANEQFVTKADLAAAVAGLRAEFRTGLAALENRMLKVAFGFMLANVTLTVALVKLLRAGMPWCGRSPGGRIWS